MLSLTYCLIHARHIVLLESPKPSSQLFWVVCRNPSSIKLNLFSHYNSVFQHITFVVPEAKEKIFRNLYMLAKRFFTVFNVAVECDSGNVNLQRNKYLNYFCRITVVQQLCRSMHMGSRGQQYCPKTLNVGRTGVLCCLMLSNGHIVVGAH